MQNPQQNLRPLSPLCMLAMRVQRVPLAWLHASNTHPAKDGCVDKQPAGVAVARGDAFERSADLDWLGHCGVGQAAGTQLAVLVPPKAVGPGLLPNQATGVAPAWQHSGHSREPSRQCRDKANAVSVP